MVAGPDDDASRLTECRLRCRQRFVYIVRKRQPRITAKQTTGVACPGTGRHCRRSQQLSRVPTAAGRKTARETTTTATTTARTNVATTKT